MSPTAGDIFSRAIGCGYGHYYDRYRNRCVRRGTWSFWGRWVMLGLIIAFILAMMVAFCVRSRRARRNGARPMYGTGWMAPPGSKFGPVPPQQQQQGPPPAGGYGMQGHPPAPPPPAYGQDYYGPPPPGAAPYAGYGPPPGGGVQQPPGTYQPPVYSPPAGPPPGR